MPFSTKTDHKSGKYIFWGATGQAKVLFEILVLQGSELIAVFDKAENITAPIANVTVYNHEWQLAKLASESQTPLHGIAAIGGSRGRDRLNYMKMFRQYDILTPSLVHSTAVVSSSTTMGSNCQILSNSTISVEVELGDAVIVNTAASIDHECILSDGVHIGPGACLAGSVRVEKNAFIGAGATIAPRISIGESAIVGAGATVIRDVAPFSTVVGNPANVIS